MRSDKLALHPGGEESGGDANDKKRKQGHDVSFPGNGAALPPQDDENCGRQSCDHGLGHQTQYEKSERGEIGASVPVFVEAEIKQC